PIAGVLSLALVVRTALEGQIGWIRAIGWMALVVITFAAGGGLAFLGDLSRRYVAENEFLSRINRTTHRRLKTLPRLPGTTQQELKLRSLMSVTFDQTGQPAGRIFLLNQRDHRKPFQKAD